MTVYIYILYLQQYMKDSPKIWHGKFCPLNRVLASQFNRWHWSQMLYPFFCQQCESESRLSGNYQKHSQSVIRNKALLICMVLLFQIIMFLVALLMLSLLQSRCEFLSSNFWLWTGTFIPYS